VRGSITSALMPSPSDSGASNGKSCACSEAPV
jgi:hypothetical protein